MVWLLLSNPSCQGRELREVPAFSSCLQMIQKHPVVSALASVQQELKSQNFSKLWTKQLKTKKLKAFLRTKSQEPSHKTHRPPFAACWSSACASNYTLITFAHFFPPESQSQQLGHCLRHLGTLVLQELLHSQQGSHWKLHMIFPGAQG